ncbi:MAG: D-amino-acid transaminase [Myxococcales bacterium]|nr:MAG: D-amino-acid transaminase [Myxococcales bacterium]
MSRTVYVNGEYFPEEDARISVFDRGFLMADGVYEVSAVMGGKLVDYPGHVVRLHRSLGEMKLTAPVSDDELLEIHRELIRRNNLVEGLVYLQVTRGAADRDFVWPVGVTPSLVMFTQQKAFEDSEGPRNGIKVVSQPDIRWGRRDIKTLQLLYPSFARMQAKAQGADDAWLVEDGFVTEGTSNNAYIVTKAGTIITRNLSNNILHGITRASVLKLAAEAQMKVEERPFTIAEAQNAAEAFITAASTFVCPVVEIDGKKISEGKPGPVAKRLREIYLANARATAV